MTKINDLQQIKEQLDWAKANLDSPLDNLDVPQVEWLIGQAEETEHVKDAYNDRIDDINSLESILDGVKNVYESGDRDALIAHIHDLFTEQLIENN